MFIGRDQELKKLNQMYASGKLEVAIIYGRRRVGKTTLITEFCKGKKTVFFAAQENNTVQNLESFSNAIAEVDTNSSAHMTFRSFGDAFTRLAEIASSERLIVVIDEYPYLAGAEKGISSLLQNYLDHQFKATKLFLILCGSSMSFMEKQVLGYQSPLYGRRTAQFKILPFQYLETGKWFPNYSFEEKALMYGITGGIPLYLEQFSPTLSIRENLLQHLFNKNALLFEEPSNLFKQELREPSTYNAIITAIASGRTRLSEIATTVGMESGLCSKYLSNLITLGIIKRETPVTESGGKRSIYLIDDQFFRFWFTFVPKNMSSILSGRIEDNYAAAIEPRLSDYMGLTFEKMCRDYILYYADDLPILLGEIGQWWGGHPQTHKQAQIDLVVSAADENACIVGSCKYRNAPVDADELALLKDYAAAMRHFEKYYYYIFSKSGFTAALKAQDADVRLLTLKELYGA